MYHRSVTFFDPFVVVRNAGLSRVDQQCVTVVNDYPTVEPNGSEGRDRGTASEVPNQGAWWCEPVKQLDPFVNAILLRPPGSCHSAGIISLFIHGFKQSLQLLVVLDVLDVPHYVTDGRQIALTLS